MPYKCNIVALTVHIGLKGGHAQGTNRFLAPLPESVRSELLGLRDDADPIMPQRATYLCDRTGVQRIFAPGSQPRATFHQQRSAFTLER